MFRAFTVTGCAMNSNDDIKCQRGRARSLKPLALMMLPLRGVCMRDVGLGRDQIQMLTLSMMCLIYVASFARTWTATTAPHTG